MPTRRLLGALLVRLNEPGDVACSQLDRGECTMKIGLNETVSHMNRLVQRSGDRGCASPRHEPHEVADRWQLARVDGELECEHARDHGGQVHGEGLQSAASSGEVGNGERHQKLVSAAAASIVGSHTCTSG